VCVCALHASDALLLKKGQKKSREVAIVVSKKNVAESWYPFFFFFLFFHQTFSQFGFSSLWCSFFMFKQKRKVTLIALVRAVSEDFTVQIGALHFAFSNTL